MDNIDYQKEKISIDELQEVNGDDSKTKVCCKCVPDRELCDDELRGAALAVSVQGFYINGFA